MKIYFKIIPLFFLIFPLFAFAATNDFVADGNITVSSVTFDNTSVDMIIFSGSTAESWSYNSGTFTVTNPGSFMVGSASGSVKSISVTRGGSTAACGVNSIPGTSYLTLPTTAGIYTIIPSTAIGCGGGGGGLPPAAYSPPSAPSSGFSVVINNNDTYTAARNVVLKLNAGSDTTKMAISENPDFSYASLETYQSTKKWVLYEGDGTKTIYVKFYTKWGQASEIVSDNIILRTLSDQEAERQILRPPADEVTAHPRTPKSQPKDFIEIPPINRSLFSGSSGGQVINLQNRLKQLGFLSSDTPSNGHFGPETKQAVMEFQKAKGIYPIGIVGPRTRKALNNQEFITNKDYQFTQDCKYNDRGEEVKQLQTRLRDLNFFPYWIRSTGWFGPITEKAVRIFQKFYNLNITGIIDRLAREILNK